MGVNDEAQIFGFHFSLSFDINSATGVNDEAYDTAEAKKLLLMDLRKKGIFMKKCSQIRQIFCSNLKSKRILVLMAVWVSFLLLQVYERSSHLYDEMIKRMAMLLNSFWLLVYDASSLSFMCHKPLLQFCVCVSLIFIANLAANDWG
ncbi:sulfite exporter TauE/SafE family protein [Trifolium repens]|nr:sulfite exporter TauE/SafE family protein [Trifolium repens]